MEKAEIQYLAQNLFEAKNHARPLAQLSRSLPSFTRSDAYSIQEEQLRLHLQRGTVQRGWKMGLTSEAKRRQMNLDAPLYGFLLNNMEVRSLFSLKGTIHPKIEPELAFEFSKDLSFPCTRSDVEQALLTAYPALEILDSRYDQFKYFSMEDVIADNSSSSHFVLGAPVRNFKGMAWDQLAVKMSAGTEVREGRTDAVSGHPFNSVVELCELLSHRGQSLRAGQLVLTGAITTAVDLAAGIAVQLNIQGFEPISLRVEA